MTTESPRDISRTFAGSLLFLASVLVLWAARDYLAGGAPYGDDNSSHLAWMMHIAQLLRSGHWDFFFGQQNMGVPMFLAYQPLPGLVSGSLYALLASWVQPWTLYKCTLILLWAAMPVSWYVGSRWLGLSRFASLLVGLLILGIQDPNNYGLTFQSIAYRGLYAQLYGMLFLPLAIGSCYRFLIAQEGTLRTPVLLFWLTFLSHAFFGIYVGIASFLMIGLKRESLLWRLWNTLLLYSSTIILLLFWMLPLLLHVGEVGGLPWKLPLQNGWGLSTSILNVLTGDVFDYNRTPWLTALVLSGMVTALLQFKKPLIRWLLALFAVTALMFLGRTTWGEWYNQIPLHRELNVMRYISGLHFCGVLFAALGLDSLFRWLGSQTRYPKVAQNALLGSTMVLVALSGMFLHSRYQHWTSRLRTLPLHSTIQPAVTYLAKAKKHRYIAHKKLGTTNHFHRDLLSALSGRAHIQSFGMTFHATLSTYYTEYFDFSDAACRLYNVHTLVSRGRPAGLSLKSFRLKFKLDPYRIYEHKDTFGYFEFARIALTIRGKLKAIRPTVRAIAAPMFRANLLAQIVSPPAPTRIPKAITKLGQSIGSWLWGPPPSRASILTAASIHVQNNKAYKAHLFGKDVTKKMTLQQYASRIRSRFGTPAIRSKVLSQRAPKNAFHARVLVTQTHDFLLLKVNYFPYWKAFVGYKQLRIFRVAPNFMAVQLPRGQHHVRFVYQNPSYQKWLFLLSILTALALFIRGRFKLTERYEFASKPQPVNNPVESWIEQFYGEETPSQGRPQPK